MTVGPDAAAQPVDGQAPPSGAFERVRVIALRAAQLMQGCTSRLPASHRATVTARHEVDAGLVRALTGPEETGDPAQTSTHRR